MIWHIFRKDLKLLWPIVAVLAAVHLVNATLLIVGGAFARSSELIETGNLVWVSNLALPALGIIGLVLLVVRVVQQDPFPGTTQDWLTRPIDRGQLLAAKLLFVVLACLAPILVGDIAMGMGAQLRLGDVISASLTRSLVLLGFICAPAAMLASVTRKFTEVLLVGIGIAVAAIAASIAIAAFKLQPRVLASGYGWVEDWIFLVANIGLLALVLPLQARWRSTHRVRWILLIAVCLESTIVLLPWNAAFRVQKAFDRAGIGALSVEADDSRPPDYNDFRNYPRGMPKPEWALVTFPLKVKGVDAKDRVYLDREVIRLVGPDGRDIYNSNADALGARLGPTGLIQVRQADQKNSLPDVSFRLPTEAFAKARAAHAQLVLDLTLTKFTLSSEQRAEQLLRGSSDGRMQCSERKVNPAFDNYVFCVSATRTGNCVEAYAHSQEGDRQKTHFNRCGQVTYTPWPLPLWRDPYYTVGYGSPSAWLDQQDPQAGPARSVTNDLIMEEFEPVAHEQHSVSVSIDMVMEKSEDRPRHTVDGVGAAARFHSPGAAVLDRKGNLYIVDESDSVIRKVTPDGAVSVYAGKPQQRGHADGAAEEARFAYPVGLGIDASGNLFVADTGNDMIRKISPAGVVSTVSGAAEKAGSVATPLHLDKPVAVIPAADGSLYVVQNDRGNGSQSGPGVKKILPDGTVTNVAGPDDKIEKEFPESADYEVR